MTHMPIRTGEISGSWTEHWIGTSYKLWGYHSILLELWVTWNAQWKRSLRFSYITTISTKMQNSL